MPALTAFGRKWKVGSDDFVYTEIFDAVVQAVCIVIALSIFFVKGALSECRSPWHSVWFYHFLFLCIINSVEVVLSLATAFSSSRGSILEPEKRWAVPICLYLGLPVFAVNVAWTVWYTVIHYHLVIDALGSDKISLCYEESAITLIAAVQWAHIIAHVFVFLFTFNPVGRQVLINHRTAELDKRYWDWNFAWIVIGKNASMRKALKELGVLLAGFFERNDYVFTDLIAGLLLRVGENRKRRMEAEANGFASGAPVVSNGAVAQHPVDDGDTELKLPKPPQWMEFPAAYPTMLPLMKYAVAMYAWPNYIVIKFTGLLEIFLHCRLFKNGYSLRNVKIVGDGVFYHRTAAFLAESGVDHRKILYSSFVNGVYQTPFVVFVDEEKQTLVVAIRGSSSLEDFVTDAALTELAIAPVHVTEDETLNRLASYEDGRRRSLDKEVHVHGGMLQCANFILGILREEALLEKFPNYGVTVCGHSLGAGVTSLLTLLLLEECKDREVRGYAFSPPGCMVSEDGLATTQQFVFSLVVGDDVVPRLSYQAMQRLFYVINHSILKSKLPKYKILWKSFSDYIQSLVSAEHQRETTPPQSHANLSNLPRHADSIELRNAEREGGMIRVKMYTPGCIMHLTDRGALAEGGQLRMEWIHYKQLREIKLTPYLLSDHMPHRVKGLFNRTGQSEMAPVED